MTRFDELGLATIKDLPTQRFHEIVDALMAAGWEKVDEYAGMDAWIDYGSIDLMRGDERIHCEWDNWSEGSLEGKRATIHAIGAQHGLPVAYQSRWEP